jgi:hypothetical protein
MSGTPAREDSLPAGLRTIAEFNAGTERLRADLGVPASGLPSIGAAVLAEAAERHRRQLAEVSGCQSCGLSATGAEWDLLRHAQAMNFTLRRVRWLAETGAASGSAVPVPLIMAALTEPYRFPLPEVAGSLLSPAQRLLTLRALRHAANHAYAEQEAEYLQLIESLGLEAGLLQWHYGPTESDPDRGKMWCPGCGAEVYALEDGYICSGCGRQAELRGGRPG